MTDTKEPYNKSLALLTLGTIYDLADRHIDDSPAFHQVRLLSGDLGDLINADAVMVADPIVQEAVPVSDPDPWPAQTMQPMPSEAPPMPVQLPKGPLPPLFGPGHSPLDLIGRLRSMIYDRTGMDIGVDYAKRVLTDIAGDAGKDTTLLNALERAVNGDGVDRVEVRKDRTTILFTDPGKIHDNWLGKPREALKRIAGIQKPE